MRTLATIVMFVLCIVTAIVIGNYLAALNMGSDGGSGAGMALVALQLLLFVASVATMAAGGVARLVWKAEAGRVATAALVMGVVGLGMLAVSYLM